MNTATHAIAAHASYLYDRHTLAVRLMHWINVVAMTVLFMSGLQIFNAHPALYWGKSSYSGRPPVFQIDTVTGADGSRQVRAFPAWITVPARYALGMAREWHFFFAWVFVLNGAAYVLYAVGTRHLMRDLAPTGADWRGIGQAIKDHVRFKHPRGDAARRYNVLQKLAYLGVIFVLLPLIILAGWAMSPFLNSIAPGWVDWLGGRQSARTIHFIVAWLLFLFVAVHVFEVIVSGLWNHLRSMITGRYRITRE